jgi:hypothetical protein
VCVATNIDANAKLRRQQSPTPNGAARLISWMRSRCTQIP